jgi:hypothetical protein
MSQPSWCTIESDPGNNNYNHISTINLSSFCLLQLIWLLDWNTNTGVFTELISQIGVKGVQVRLSFFIHNVSPGRHGMITG